MRSYLEFAAFRPTLMTAAVAAVLVGTTLPVAASDPVADGKYLAAAAHCAACHTSRADRPYAGNVAIDSKFGTMYSSNITPDPATGIGAWNEAEFTSALRDGKGRHGKYLYPSMPYTDFTKISDADVHALWAYFRSLPAIAEKTRANRMKFPFNVRPGIAAWQAVFFKPGRFVPDTTQTAEWNRGAYLVQGLGHCGACHTPKNFAMADKNGRALQGAPTGDDWFAPDISGGRFSGIADWSRVQLVAYLKTGHNDKNVAAIGPMLATIAQGTHDLDDADLQAMATYLKRQPAEKETVATTAVAVAEDRRAAGAGIYASHCASCHGGDGRGVDGVAPALAGNSALTTSGPENVVHAVLGGFAPSGRWGAMPSFTDVLDGQEIADVTNYVRTAWGSLGSALSTAYAVNRLREKLGPTDPRIQAALLCPPVPQGAIDKSTQAQLLSLAKAADTGVPVPRGLVADYRRRHPEVARSEAASVLAGGYCRSLMSEAGGRAADKQARLVQFMAATSAQAASR